MHPVGDVVDPQRVDQHPATRGDELARPADSSCHDRAARSHRFENREAEGLDEARLAHDIRGCDPRTDLVMWHPPDHANALAAFELRPHRPVAHVSELPGFEPREGRGEAQNVLALIQRPDVHVERPSALPRQLASRLSRVGQVESRQIDAAVDHLHVAKVVG